MIHTLLMPHQKKAVQYCMERERVLLAMFLGSGKSLVSLAVADERKAKRVLVTSDKNNIVNTWKEQIYAHTDYECLVRPTPKQLESLPEKVCVCVNYELLATRWKDFAHVPWDMWIGDESGEFKNQRTDKHKNLARVVRDIECRILLNGAVMTEALEDLFGQFKLLDDGESLGRSLTAFRSRYMQPDPTGYGWVPQRSALTRIQKDAQDVSYWLPKDPRVKLPERVYYLVSVQPTPKLMELDEELQRHFRASLNGLKIDTAYAGALFVKRHQLCSGVFRPTEDEEDEGSKDLCVGIPNNKEVALRTIIRNNVDSKIVVWHEYRPETEVLAFLIRDLNLTPLFVCEGSHDSKTLEAFARAKTGVLLIRNSMCKGLNQLRDVNLSIIYTAPFSYQKRAQLEARACRLSSRGGETSYVDIVTEGGVDEHVYHLLKQKKSLSLTLSTLRGILDAEQSGGGR